MMKMRAFFLGFLLSVGLLADSVAFGQNSSGIDVRGETLTEVQGQPLQNFRGEWAGLNYLEVARQQAASEKAWFESLVHLKRADYEAAVRLAQEAQLKAQTEDVQRAHATLELATQDLNRSTFGLQLARQQLDERESHLFRAREVQANQVLEDWLVQRQLVGSDEEPARSEYWIGVQCEPATEIGLIVDTAPQPLTIKGGLTVTSVIADSPAISAGVHEQDVILYMNDRATNQLEELVAVITENQDREAKLTLVREQRLITLAISPAKRPVENASPHILAGVPLVGRLFRADIPNGYEARIHFAPGTGPEFRILQGENSWTVTGDNFDQLPEDTRPFAQSIWTALGVQNHGQTEHQVYGSFLTNQVVLSEPKLLTYYAQLAQPNSDLNSKLDQLQQQLQEIQKQLDTLKK